ncbi:GTP cyclohydrolase FolE2 [Natroniella sulfidigena]|uniref:GTP cyclohydrolase FolE2 n=1 Tax=Natroniella sulfidigena TaxID=723921 RepID=UPI00200A7D5B|nr:GTP cyclohydrolase FolE2 [Natroniella sulfidigena]MCK8818168.1 GTP cyclohydrolase FolE2 [Natroniella sulfidigena]
MKNEEVNQLKDIQNQEGDYGFAINKVGVDDLTYPVKIKAQSGEVISTVGKFALAVDLERNLKGINMSRLPILLAELRAENWIIERLKPDLKEVLKAMQQRMEAKNAYLDLEFDYFIDKEAPVSDFAGLVPYKCGLETSLQEDDYDLVLQVEIPVTTLCPCSKEISAYSAHNQRGYVQVAVRYKDSIWIEELIELVEEVASCEVYSILKREDEKYITEKAYRNPRFVEDIVRLVAEKLDQKEEVTWFRVSSKHQESIHPHDAYAVLEKWKK